MSDKPKFPAAAAKAVAKEVIDALRPVTERIICAGSLRRRKEEVGDVEVVYIPKWERNVPVAGDFFARESRNLADAVILQLEDSGVLARRKTAIRTETYGPKNKLMVHVASGIPVDLFATNEASWWNYLVCRTGPGESNTRIASLARKKGWQWNPYGAGFTRVGLDPSGPGEYVVKSEDQVFHFVGLPYKEPWER